jgi:hypothetical protein
MEYTQYNLRTYPLRSRTLAPFRSVLKCLWAVPRDQCVPDKLPSAVHHSQLTATSENFILSESQCLDFLPSNLDYILTIHTASTKLFSLPSSKLSFDRHQTSSCPGIRKNQFTSKTIGFVAKNLIKVNLFFF